MENILFGHVTLGMLIAFSIGVSLVFVYGAWKAKNTKSNRGYSIKKYAKPSLLNIIYQILTGFLFLFMLHEIGEKLMSFFGGDGAEEYHLFLSATCGALGGQFFAFLIEKGRLMLNVKDNEIAHTEMPQLDEMSPMEAVNSKHIHNDNCKH